MTDEDRRRAAQAVLTIPYFIDLWNELENAAINATIFADYNDHETRQSMAAEARAIKRVRERIESIAKDGQLKPYGRAPA